MTSPRDTEGQRRSLEELRAKAAKLVKAKNHGPEAISLNIEILELDPEDDAARTRLGFAYRAAGDFDSAARIYREILGRGREGRHAETAHRSLKRIEFERVHGRPRTLDELVAAVPNANDARLRAAAARKAGHLTVALRWSDRSLELAERQGRAALKRVLATRASILRRVNEPEQAVATARRAVQLDPEYSENAAAYRSLTASLVDTGQLSEALEITETYLEPHVDDSFAQKTAGRAFWNGFQASGELDLLERSARCFRQAASLPDAGPEPLRMLEEIHALLARRGYVEQAADVALFLSQLGRVVQGPQAESAA